MRMYALQSDMANDQTGEIETVTVALVTENDTSAIIGLLKDNCWRSATQNHTARPRNKVKWYVSIINQDDIPNLIWDA